MKKRVALIGLPASGKSSVGRRLATLLGLTFVDLDEYIEREAGLSIGDIFEIFGEARFREMESEALRLVAAGGPVVLAPGGGCVLAEANRAALKSSFLVAWLQASPETATMRAAGGNRPLLAGHDALSEMRRLYEERLGFYAECASIAVETEGRSIDEIVDEIRDHID